MKTRTSRPFLVAFLLAAIASPEARADDRTTVCTTAYGQAQTLRDANKLTAAREQLRICSQPTCKNFIAKDCTTWLVEVESRLPSVVLSAKDSRGQALTDVSVSMDGTPVAQKLEGRAIEVDPGQHTFTFAESDGTKVDTPFVVLEGQKAQVVAVTLPTPASAAPVQPPPVQPPPPPPDVPFWTTQRTIGAAVGGVGVAGVVLGGVFGLVASSKWNSSKSECPSAGCLDHAAAVTDHDSASSMATASTIAFVGGGAAIAAGVILMLTGGSKPSAERAPGAALVLAPAVGPRTGGVTAAGVF